jgi:hypothetical protein
MSSDIDLTGVWFGEFRYGTPESPVSFMANIDDYGGSLAGRVDEPNTFGGASASRLLASIEGTRVGQVVKFKKTYNGIAGVFHTVHYVGSLNEAMSTISGTWSVPGDWSGVFTMARPIVNLADEEEIYAVEIDA